MYFQSKRRSTPHWLILSGIILLCIAIVALIVNGSDFMRKYSYAKDKISTCTNEKNANQCMALALNYRNGVTGFCQLSGRAGSPSSNTACSYLDQDSLEAIKYADLACQFGSKEGCFYQWNWSENFNANDIETLTGHCSAGINPACKLNTAYARKNNKPLVLTKTLETACNNGAVLACLNLTKLKFAQLKPDDKLGLMKLTMSQLQPQADQSPFKLCLAKTADSHYACAFYDKLTKTLQNTIVEPQSDASTTASNVSVQTYRPVYLGILDY